MFCAKLASLMRLEVAKPSVAPGREVVDDLQHRRAFVTAAACPGSTSTDGGRSPVACAVASESTPSDSTHTLTPVPSKPKNARAAAARCVVSPSDVLTLLFVARCRGRSHGRRAAWRCRSIAETGSRTRAERYRVDAFRTWPPAAPTASTSALTSDPANVSMSSAIVPSTLGCADARPASPGNLGGERWLSISRRSRESIFCSCGASCAFSCWRRRIVLIASGPNSERLGGRLGRRDCSGQEQQRQNCVRDDPWPDSCECLRGTGQDRGDDTGDAYQRFLHYRLRLQSDRRKPAEWVSHCRLTAESRSSCSPPPADLADGGVERSVEYRCSLR